MENKPVYNVEEAAEFLGVSTWTVREQARGGRLPANKVGREWRFSREALEEYLRGNDKPTPEEPAESAQAWLDYLSGRDSGEPLEKVRRELLEDQAWQEANLGGLLPPYEWGPEGPPKGKSVRYEPGVGLIVEGGKDSGGK